MTEIADLKKSVIALKKEIKKKSALIPGKIKLSMPYVSLELIASEILGFHSDFSVMVEELITLSQDPGASAAEFLLEKTQVFDYKNSIDVLVDDTLKLCARYKIDEANKIGSTRLSKALSIINTRYSVFEQACKDFEEVENPIESKASAFLSELEKLESEILAEWEPLLSDPHVSIEQVQLDDYLIIVNRVHSKKSELSEYITNLTSTLPTRGPHRLSQWSTAPNLVAQAASGSQGPPYQHQQTSGDRDPPSQYDQTYAPQGVSSRDMRRSQRTSLGIQTRTPVIKKMEAFEFNGDKDKYAEWKLFWQNVVEADYDAEPNWESHLTSLLKKKVKGEAKDVIKHIMLGSTDAYTNMWRELDVAYGSQATIVPHAVQKFKAIPKMMNQDFKKLTSCIQTVEGTVTQLQQAQALGAIGLSTIDEFVFKMPEAWQFSWYTQTFPKLDSNSLNTPMIPLLSWLRDLKPYVSRLATAASSGKSAYKAVEVNTISSAPAKGSHAASPAKSEVDKNMMTCAKHVHAHHATAECDEIKAMPPAQRLFEVKRSKACFKCLNVPKDRSHYLECKADDKTACRQCPDKKRHHRLLCLKGQVNTVRRGIHKISANRNVDGKPDTYNITGDPYDAMTQVSNNNITSPGHNK